MRGQGQVNELTQSNAPNPTAQLDVVASPVNMYVAPEESMASKLGAALGVAMPGITAAADKQLKKDQDNAVIQGQTAGLQDPNGVEALKNESYKAVPESTPPALNPWWSLGYRQALGMNIAGEATNKALTEWAQNKDKPGFNFDTFMADFKNREFTGITDPEVLKTLNNHFTQAQAQLQGLHREDVIKQGIETGKANLQNGLRTSVTANLMPDEMYRTFVATVLPAGQNQGTATPDIVKAFAEHLNNISDLHGGMPGIFDAFNITDDKGKTLADTSPEVAKYVTAARVAAQHQLDTQISDDQIRTNAHLLAGFENDLTTGNLANLTEDKLMPYVSKHGLWTTAAGFASFMEKVDKARVVQGQLNAGLNLADQGYLGLEKPEDQKKALGVLMKDPMNTIIGAVHVTDPAQLPLVKQVITDAVNKMTFIYSKSGSTVMPQELEGMFKSVSSDMPQTVTGADGKEMPPVKFLAMAAVYQAIKGSPNSKVLGSALSEDDRAIFDNYVSLSTVGGASQAEAYKAAYATITPESKKKTEEWFSDPKNKQVVNDLTDKVLTTWNPLGDQAFRASGIQNIGSLQMAARMQIDTYLKANPNKLGDETAIKNELTRWYSDNFVPLNNDNGGILSRTNYLQVPPGQADETTRKALQAVQQWGINHYGKDADVYLDSVGNGYYQLKSSVGSATYLGDRFTLDQIRQGYKFSKVFTPEEGTAAGSIYKKFKDGTLTTEDALLNADVINKAIKVDGGKQKDWLAIEKMINPDQHKTKSLNEFNFSMPDVSNKGLQDSLLPNTAARSSVSQKFFDKGDMFGSLNALGEGVVLTATQGLAKGEGYNIGTGYNFKAQSANIKSDFAAAGIPTEFIPDIIAGKKSITEDQAMRLTKVAQPRYEALAKDLWDKTQGDPTSLGITWDKAPAAVKAILTDIAWQRGNLNNDLKRNFKPAEAVKAFKTHDYQTAMDNLKVYYHDAKTNQDLFDEGRHNKRIALLAAPQTFNALIKAVSKKPTNLAQAMSPSNQ